MASLVLTDSSQLTSDSQHLGCVVYTGQETKLALNSRLTSNKFSTVEKSINGFLLFFMGLLLVEVALCLGLKYHTELQGVFIAAEYLGPVPVFNFRNVLQDLLSFFILFNYIIPISLYVTIEMQKFLGTLFFEWDEGLFCEETGQAAICNTSDLNEELGQEKMERFLLGLALCHTVQLSNASKRLTMNNNLTEGDLLSMHLDYQASSPDEKALVEAAARCGVVFVGEKGDTMFVLVKGQLQHFTRLECLEFTSGGCMETSSVVSWSVDRYTMSDGLQAELVLVTDRKRMSLVVRDGDGDIWLYCKGAESSVIPLTEKGPTEKTLAHLGEFALRGLRTMVVGYRKLTISQYSSFSRQVGETLLYTHFLVSWGRNDPEQVRERASSPGDIDAVSELDARGQARQTMSSHRESIIAASYSKMEAGLTLLGATGVEDKLQEGVQETLESLRAAGLKVWILTGDKVETAVNISFSCGHFKPGTVQLFLTEHHKERSCVQMLQAYSARVEADSLEQYGLVVDGQSLKFALKNQDMFRKVCMACTAVICCRMSPLQKSQVHTLLWVQVVVVGTNTPGDLIQITDVVQLVKQSPDKPITAAIGDGANDVAMIQEAHVGLGITDNEGELDHMDACRKAPNITCNTYSHMLTGIMDKEGDLDHMDTCRKAPNITCNTYSHMLTGITDNEGELDHMDACRKASNITCNTYSHMLTGIMGKEGRQAVRCSDFAFGQFRFVRRVLLVHGHWYYLRISTLVLYFFYKNIVFITPQLFFNFLSAFSTQAIYDTAYLSMYNVLFTSLPILIYGLFEQNYSDVKLLECPHLYKEIANNVLMSWCSFLKWIAFEPALREQQCSLYLAVPPSSPPPSYVRMRTTVKHHVTGTVKHAVPYKDFCVWHTTVIFYIPYFLMMINEAILLDSTPIDQWMFGSIIYHCVVTIVNLKLWFHSRYWSAVFIISIVLSIVGFIGLASIYAIIPGTMYWVYFHAISSPTFWLLSVLAIAVCLVPDTTITVLTPHILSAIYRTKVSPDAKVVWAKLTFALRGLLAYLRTRSLTIQPAKTQAVLFTRRGTGPLQPLRVEGTAVQWSPSVRWLGVTLDAKCSWDPHLRSAAGRARSVMLKLAPLLRPVSPLEYGHKIRLFLLCVMSVLLYSAPVFSYLPRYRYNHFRSVYHRFLRLILGAPPRVPNRVLLTVSGLPSLDSRIRGLAERFFSRAQASSNMIGDYDAPGRPYRRIRDGVVNPFVDVGR
uniref:P-type ATPase C-terminal domain-containing protein n=1 Tax=Timema shepardi TaxID=629360 RepID=A0A7R9B1H5_TIMSH|nr:unnamed protein product [Timema shepardi]